MTVAPEARERPWETLLELLEAADRIELQAFLDELPGSEVGRCVSRLKDEERARLVGLLTPENAADLVEAIPETQAVKLIEQLPPAESAAILGQMASDEQADLLADLERHDADAILSEMDPDEARRARTFSSYPDDSAGGLMIREFLTYPDRFTVGQVLADLRDHADRYRDYVVQYAYVTRAGRLLGVLRLRDLIFAPTDRSIREIMQGDPVSVPDVASVDTLQEFFDRYPFFGVPVVDGDGHILGIVNRAAVEGARADRSDSDYLKSLGIVGGEELRTMPLLLRSRRRLAWLSVNVVLNIVAASVIALYQETLAAVIALAVFLPIISDMSGCSGNQAVAVSMRELSLGLVKPVEVLRVWLKEVTVGSINGVALGALIAAAGWLWQGNPWFGGVVGVAMAVNTVIAVSIGGTVPLVLRRMRLDPALASGPILTTVTDMCGFFLLLSMAASMRPWLV